MKESSYKTIDEITREANRAVHKEYPLLKEEIKAWHVRYILDAYKKVMKHAIR